MSIRALLSRAKAASDKKVRQQALTAAPDQARWRGGYERIGGVGVRRPLYECPHCLALTTDPEGHEEWHKRQSRFFSMLPGGRHAPV